MRVCAQRRYRRLMLRIAGQTDAGKLPTCLGRKEIAICRAHVAGRRRTRSAAQHVLVAHELAIVLSQRAIRRGKARIRRIGTCRPLPRFAIQLCKRLVVAVAGTRMESAAVGETAHHLGGLGSVLPLEFGGQSRTRPTRKRVGLEITDVANGFRQVESAQSAQRKLLPCAVLLQPIQGRLPLLRVDRIPAER